IFAWSGGIPGLLGTVNALPLAAFAASYVAVNHLLVYFTCCPRGAACRAWPGWTPRSGTA
ncbi:MAG: hypothetical protein K6T29_06275, partial [Peptococcaceae bacterium]|nr:hypothetical protein [Peptococcaceae bacterium]